MFCLIIKLPLVKLNFRIIRCLWPGASDHRPMTIDNIKTLANKSNCEYNWIELPFDFMSHVAFVINFRYALNVESNIVHIFLLEMHLLTSFEIKKNSKELKKQRQTFIKLIFDLTHARLLTLLRINVILRWIQIEDVA